MDTHTLELLEFDKVRTLVAARAACSLGKAAAQRIEPSVDPGEIHNRQALTTEMVEALGSGLRPPFGGLHDIRHLARRASKESVLEAEELAETVETLRAIGNLDAWLARVGDQFPRLGGLRQGVGEFSGARRRHRGMPRQPGQGARHRQPPALRPAARDRPRPGTNPGNAPADAPFARDPADSPLPQFHDGRAPLRPARGQGPSRRGAGLRSSHQRQQRDRLRRADRHQRTIGPALVPPRARGEGGAPDSALALRPGRHGGGVAAGHARDHGGARPDPRPGPSEHRLSNVGPALQRGGTAGAAQRPASLARSAVSQRSRDRRPAAAACRHGRRPAAAASADAEPPPIARRSLRPSHRRRRRAVPPYPSPRP